MAELADAYGSGPYGATRGGSSPLASSYSCRATDSQIYPQLPDVSREAAAYFEPAFLLAAQRAFISWESFLRPAGVSWPFFLAGAATPVPRLLAQRARAAAASFALVAGEK